MTITERPLGGYIWYAVTTDDTIIWQYDENGIERSIDAVRDLAVKQVVLTPRAEQHRTIVLDAITGDAWLKYWVRTFDRDTMYEHPTIDCVALQSTAPVRLFIYPDGSIKVTTSTEP